MQRQALLALVVALAITALANVVHAQDDEARELYQAGLTAYQNGRFENAMRHFRSAYELSPRPELLYNIGQAADRLRRDAEALDAFERYLAAVPDSPHRTTLEARMAILRESIARDRALAEEAARPEEAAPVDGGGGSSTLGWIFAGGGAATAVAGGVLMILAATAQASVEEAGMDRFWEGDVENDFDRARTFSITGLLLIGVGVAAATTGVILLAGDE